jgi:hypothetical protein
MWLSCSAALCCAEMQALPPDNQPLKPVNASRLSVWICEGDKGIDSRLDALLPPSHTMILWAAAACRVTALNVHKTKLTGICRVGTHLPTDKMHVQ